MRGVDMREADVVAPDEEPHLPSVSDSRSSTPQDDGGALPQLNSSRGVEDHRSDPALRSALDKLDELRISQPNMDDFSLDSFRSKGAAAPPDALALASSAPRVVVPPALREGPMFSLDLLMAAASFAPGPPDIGAAAIAAVGYPPRQGALLSGDMSRSTTPGSAATSAFSASVHSLGSADSPLLAPPPVERPRLPPRNPMPPSGPRRPGGRPRAPDSARTSALTPRRRIQAAVESAAADLAAYSTPHSAR